MRIESKGAVENPIVGIGSILELGGRSATLQGQLVDSGGVANSVTLYYGDTDAIESPGDWNHSLSLGTFDQGPINAGLSGLNSGQTYYYRFASNNSAGTDWSGPGTFATLSFDQGTLRFDTGSNETGDSAGLFWNKGTPSWKKF